MELNQLIPNVISQLAIVRNELARLADEDKRVYQQIDRIYARQKEEYAELEKCLKELDKDVNLKLDALLHKEIERATREKTIARIAAIGFSSGLVSLVFQFIQFLAKN